MNPTDNLSEYLLPHLYDLENPYDEQEGAFFLALAEQAQGPILDLGCGTGRITIPLAQHGYDVTGLDVVHAMLEHASKKAGSLPIHWIQSDARTFHLSRQFMLIYENGSVFMHMLTRTDQLSFLSCIREHLAPGGLFAFSVLFPHPQYLQSDVQEKEWFSYQTEEGWQVNVSGFESYDELLQVKTETAIRRIFQGGEVVQTINAPLSLRYTFPQELETLLDISGFEIKERFGSMDRRPLEADSKLILIICALKTS